ncbi:MAG: HDOD domain-containing protein [Desulfobulbus sp.]|uniref:HDOD domain-containing protein n=1 Tax=uncultured Desulfobulbus sp. TaxID=239745 RepID=UPI001B3CE274|nr:HDOD domain-containing protein [uncultured Desulfobulbus sp.]MBP7517321.1 HDOD domain-containing protein [Desulfobulbus sp.]
MAAPISLLDVINRYIAADTLSLPVFNNAAVRLQMELVKPEPDLRVIEQVITSDQALSSQVLKIANSAFYRGLVEVGTVRAAIIRLGMREIGRIVLMAASEQHFRSRDRTIALVMKKLWQHSVGCAYGTAWLARRRDCGVEQSQAFFAGLFHDVGKLFVLMVIEQIKRKNKSLKLTDSLLMEAMNRLHAREGSRLLTRWNMPGHLHVIARDHHNAEIDAQNRLLVLVRMANLVCRKLGIGLAEDGSLLLAATPEANLLGLTGTDLAELEGALEDTRVLSS